MLASKFRSSLQMTLLAAAIAAGMCGAFALFIESNRQAWLKEQSFLFEGIGVRWNDRSYIPNLDIDFSPTLPEWLIDVLPVENKDIFYRVTHLDLAAGTASVKDFDRCLGFTNVNTIRLDDFEEPHRLVAVFKQFPRLRTIEIGKETDWYGASISEAIKEELPHVEIIR